MFRLDDYHADGNGAARLIARWTSGPVAGSCLVSGEVFGVPRELDLTAHADIAGCTSRIQVHVTVAFKHQEVAEKEH